MEVEVVKVQKDTGHTNYQIWRDVEVDWRSGEVEKGENKR